MQLPAPPPGLDEHQAPPGATIQLVGKNLRLAPGTGAARVALRRGGRSLELPAAQAEPFSLRVKLPEDLAAGRYELWAHNGSGGDAERGWRLQRAHRGRA